MPRDPLDNPGPLIKSVYAYVAYRIGDGPDAQDVTSETFARALRFGADLTAKQIGELTGRKTHAVEVALQRTLLRLRDRLDESDPAAPAGADAAAVRFRPARRYSGVDT